jgi:hypothetical protein
MKAGTFSHRGPQQGVRAASRVGSRRLSSILIVAGALVLVMFVLWIANRAAGIRSNVEGDTPPAAMQAAALPRPMLAPQIEPLPARGRRPRPGSDPGSLDRALTTQSPSELQLLGDLGRLGLQPPPVLDELFERRRAGATPDELRRFVRARFPRSLKLRMATMRWIKRTDPTRTPEASPGRAGGGRPLGSLAPGAPARR